MTQNMQKKTINKNFGNIVEEGSILSTLYKKIAVLEGVFSTACVVPLIL